MSKVEFIPEEKELFIAAAKDGVFNIITIDQLPGPFVRVGKKNYLVQSDPAFAAKYLEAYKTLCEEGYIDEKSDTYAVLTGSGFKKARELAEEKLKAIPPQDEAN